MNGTGRRSALLGVLPFLCGIIALLSCPKALSAQTTGLSLSLNAPSFATGQTMTVTARLTPLTPVRTVDAYVVVQLPTGQFLSLQTGGGLIDGLHPIAQSFVPVDLVTALTQYTFTGSEPAGTYAWYAVLTEPGTMNFVSPLSQAVFTVESLGRGRVLDYQTQSAVRGAVVRFQMLGTNQQQQSATTDIDGMYTLPALLNGTATVSVNDDVVGILELTGADYYGDLFVNWGTCAARYGRVVDASTLRPIVGATITLPGSLPTATDTNGWYRIDRGCAASGGFGNTTVLRVTHPQYAPADLVVGRGVFGVSRLDVKLVPH